MIDFTLQQDIDRPVSDVLAYVTEPARVATWQPSTVSPGETSDVHLRMWVTPLEHGTRVSLRVRSDLGGLKRLMLAPVLNRQLSRQLGTLKSVLEQLDPVPEGVC